MKKILIVGNGGREHAIARAVAKNSDVGKVYCAPGNGGTAIENKCENIDITDLDSLADFAEKEDIYMTIPGPEAILVKGIVDLFKKRNLRVFGPHKKGAMLEGSKALAKDFMKKYGVKTAEYERFNDYSKAMSYLQEATFPLVVKADGLAAGKGVIICSKRDEAELALKEIMLDARFGEAGNEVVIEEFLEGKEASILSIYDGKDIIPFLSAKDHKKIGEGETGPNTGGMGVVAPNPYVTDQVMKDYIRDIQEPTLKGLLDEGLLFAGVIFFGLMINDRGVFLLEYNIRFGDPECQTVFPLLKTDLLTLLDTAIDGKAADVPLEWEEGAACCVVLASGGYPGNYKKGIEITGLDKVQNHYYIAGAEEKEGRILTSGGRVLNLVAVGKDLEEARKKAYSETAHVGFEDAYFRNDIGL